MLSIVGFQINSAFGSDGEGSDGLGSRQASLNQSRVRGALEMSGVTRLSSFGSQDSATPVDARRGRKNSFGSKTTSTQGERKRSFGVQSSVRRVIPAPPSEPSAPGTPSSSATPEAPEKAITHSNDYAPKRKGFAGDDKEQQEFDSQDESAHSGDGSSTYDGDAEQIAAPSVDYTRKQRKPVTSSFGQTEDDDEEGFEIKQSVNYAPKKKGSSVSKPVYFTFGSWRAKRKARDRSGGEDSGGSGGEDSGLVGGALSGFEAIRQQAVRDAAENSTRSSVAGGGGGGGTRDTGDGEVSYRDSDDGSYQDADADDEISSRRKSTSQLGGAMGGADWTMARASSMPMPMPTKTASGSKPQERRATLVESGPVGYPGAYPGAMAGSYGGAGGEGTARPSAPSTPTWSPPGTHAASPAQGLRRPDSSSGQLGGMTGAGAASQRLVESGPVGYLGAMAGGAGGEGTARPRAPSTPTWSPPGTPGVWSAR